MINIQKLNENNIKEIDLMLEQKIPVIEISKKYNVDKTTMYKFIKKNNLKLNGDLRKINFSDKEIVEIKRLYLEAGISMKKIGTIYNVDEHVIKRFLIKNNVEIRHSGQQYCYNSHYFEKINSEIKAYFLGLLTSDGNLINPNCNKSTFTVQINLQEQDKIVLDIIAKDIIIGGKKLEPLFIDKSKENVKNQYRLSITNKTIFNDLLKLGLCERKSLVLTNLCKDVPANLYNHYIRGLFDGDGTTNINSDLTCKIGYYSGSKSFAEDFQKYCINNLNMSELKIYHGTTYFCTWSKRSDIIKFFNYIYKDATIYLPRKYYKILKMLELKENTEEIIIPKKILTP